MVVLKTVLVATDFGGPAEVALTYGRELARTFGATLHVLHVAADLSANVNSWSGTVPELGGFQADLEENARKRLERWLPVEDREVLHAKTAVVTSMRTAQAIVDYAKDEHADLIIVGTHGRGPLAHFMLGSVAERVVRSAPCPVLTVRHSEHEFVRPGAP
jgi:nucleotide-binding universal stress UspA family protein